MIGKTNAHNSPAFGAVFPIKARSLDKVKNRYLSEIIANTMADRLNRGVVGHIANVPDRKGVFHVVNGDEGSFLGALREALEQNKFETLGLSPEKLGKALNQVVSNVLKGSFELFNVKKV